MGKKNKRKSKHGLPKQLFVSARGSGDEAYFEAQESAEKMVDVCDSKDDAIQVGVYVLQEVGTISTSTTYQRKPFTKD